MRTLIRSLICCSALLLAAWAGQTAQAAPISGSFSMAGGWIPIGGTGSIGTATGMDFIPKPGVMLGQFSVTAPGGSGAFSSLTAGELGTVKEFSFAPFTGTVSDFISVGGFTLDLQNVAVEQQNSQFLLLDGVVEVSGPGVTAQQAIFLLSSNGMGTSFAWSGTAGFEDQTNTGGGGDNGGSGGTTTGTGGNPTSVPEPMSLAMLGFGLVGYGMMRRRAAR